MSLATILAVFVGGFFGAALRYALSAPLNARAAAERAMLPWGTLFVNSTGAFGFGVVSALVVDPLLRQALLTGFMGAYTTFSTLMLEIDTRLRGGRLWAAIFYAVVSFVGGPFWVALGKIFTDVFIPTV